MNWLRLTWQLGYELRHGTLWQGYLSIQLTRLRLHVLFSKFTLTRFIMNYFDKILYELLWQALWLTLTDFFQITLTRLASFFLTNINTICYDNFPYGMHWRLFTKCSDNIHLTITWQCFTTANFTWKLWLLHFNVLD